jgi:branched-chain amino acid transport system permease protein
MITRNPYYLRVLIITGIFAIYAASWDVLAGYAGQLNLGHGVFFGIGGYTVALLNLHFGLPSWVIVPLGGCGAVIGGAIVALPVLRLRGFYLALVTLSFPIILMGVILRFKWFTGGDIGLSGFDRLTDSRITSYYVVLIAMVICTYIMYKVTTIKSKIIRVGIVFHALREDEISARAAGINTKRYKILAFIVSSFFAGIAGSFYVLYMGIADPSSLQLFFSFQVILWAIFGGIRTIYGPVAGVYLLYPLIELLRLHPIGNEIRFMLFAFILIIILLFMPEGLTTWVLDKIEIECPRCKLRNIFRRRVCRACNASMHLGPERGVQ